MRQAGHNSGYLWDYSHQLWCIVALERMTLLFTPQTESKATALPGGSVFRNLVSAEHLTALGR